MSSFDVAVYAGLIAAMAIGFKSGLLRSAATILGYLIAMPIALWVTALLLPRIQITSDLPMAQSSMVFFAAFVASGILLGTLLRSALDEAVGSQIGIVDRLGGAALGAVRVGLIAITMVLIFDELIPAHAQPSFLVGSQLRPILSAAGQRGFKSLPPDVAAYLDQLKRSHRI
jgi:membrane protein required for colicin V production